jgi:hypothetical protein
MSGKLRLTVACGDYEIVRALKEGTVTADGLDLVLLTGMGSKERHWRMARKNEFDVCEINVGAYFMSRDRGEALAAIPVYLHRRFRHGFVFVNRDAGIREPKDLAGRKIGGTNFQPASNIWMRGILEENYGLTPPQRHLGGGARGGREVHAARRFAHRDDRARQEARRHAGRRRNPRHAVADPEVLGPDPWAYGLDPANRKKLEAILRYTRQQGLISRPLPLDELFIDCDLDDAGEPEEGI